MREALVYAIISLLVIGVLLLSYSVVSEAAYRLRYEGLVKKTIKNLVKPEALNAP